MIMERKDEHSQKQAIPKPVTPFGMVTDSKEQQFGKQLLKLVTQPDMATDFKEWQY